VKRQKHTRGDDVGYLFPIIIVVSFFSAMADTWIQGFGSNFFDKNPQNPARCCLTSIQGVSESPTPVNSEITIAANFPYVQQNAPTATATISPENPAYLPPLVITEEITGSPTPTPIPIQTGEFNIPILVGAVVIILIILLTWAVFYRIEH
jgi:hypothetical protein